MAEARCTCHPGLPHAKVRRSFVSYMFDMDPHPELFSSRTVKDSVYE